MAEVASDADHIIIALRPSIRELKNCCPGCMYQRGPAVQRSIANLDPYPARKQTQRLEEQKLHESHYEWLQHDQEPPAATSVGTTCKEALGTRA